MERCRRGREHPQRSAAEQAERRVKEIEEELGDLQAQIKRMQKDKQLRGILKLEFQAFHTGTGLFSLKFDDDFTKLPDGHTLTIAEVSSWVHKTGGHESRLAWFEVNAPKSPFFLMVAKPLLSVRITGSMTVERVAKPLKNRPSSTL